VKQADPPVDIAKKIVELCDRFTGRRRQFVLPISEDLYDDARLYAAWHNHAVFSAHPIDAQTL
jgi:hypothetical protein